MKNNGKDLNQPDLSSESPPFSLAVWLRLVNDEHATNRCAALEDLPDEAADDVIAEAIINALRDKDALVRVCAADAARLLRGRKDTADALRHLIKTEHDELVLAYAYASLGRYGDAQDVAVFTQAFSTVSNTRTRLSMMGGFCLLLRELYLSDMYSLMKAKETNLFNAAVQVFLHITDDEAILEKELLDGVDNHIKTLTLEELTAAYDTFEPLMKKINGRLGKSGVFTGSNDCNK
ncbi:MAG: HEAT repeat domain-containing protein [Methylovulum sp.]|nr:HEAT repeat domain-containing protein [Methylovulum sp.]